ncbi:hypothetical protein AKJ66_00020 [candidate division MSBL1 archaeon SCGC-AAA259E22]|uniref:ArnR1-like winged helix-turn-helix domain-containing protein n=1 Tax=candidate division MSBL1 archaeon SCGC-AAA259E22 TaxID=1698265 RepID=A0A133UIT2_9EURY|nr:hypothetical protein AKJ66_00020 [candidate division MSBL1 archaeon SCGC-AAA259E22]
MRRSKYEVVRDILALAGERSSLSKSKIKRKVGLNYTQVEKYISHLQDKGILLEGREGNPETKYKVSEKGRELKEKLDDVTDYL